MKKQIKNIIKYLIGIVNKTQIGKFFVQQTLNVSLARTTRVQHAGSYLEFAAPNGECQARADTFSTKEPETLAWIDSFTDDSIFMDIGANVGIYSCYAAKMKGAKVYAFEPSVFNLEMLARNISLNNLVDRIYIIPLALSDGNYLSLMELTSTDWGGAMSTFKEGYSWTGQPIESNFKYNTQSITLDTFVSLYPECKPDYIKIDVDGIEHLVLKGASSVLYQVKSLLVEINDDFHAQADACIKILEQSGLSLLKKEHSDQFENSKVWNQIWIRRSL